MALKFVVPNMQKTFGTLEFGDFLGERTRRDGERTRIISRRYGLFSDVQVGDEIVVTLPGDVRKKAFPFQAKVRLVNPKITAVGKVSGSNAHREFALSADDMVEVEVNA